MIGTKLLLYFLSAFQLTFIFHDLFMTKEARTEKNVMHNSYSINIMQEGWKESKSWSMRRSAVRCCPLDMTGPLQS